MKKYLLIVPFLCASIAGIAQVLVNKTDSDYTHFGSPSILPSLTATASYTFDDACRSDTGNFRSFDESTHQPTGFSRSIYSYYPGSRSLYQSILQRSAPSADSPYTNLSRQTYVYDADGLEDSAIYDTWDGSKWKPVYLLTTGYTLMGNPVFYLQQSWDARINAYVNGSRTLYEYDNSEYQTYYASQYWNNTTNLWNTAYSSSIAYDANGFEVSETDSSLKSGTNDLVPYIQTRFYNNSSGYTDSSYSFKYLDSTFSKSFLTYYTGSNHYQYRYTRYYTPDSTLLATDLQSHYFDSSAYRIFDSTAFSTDQASNGNFVLGLTVSSSTTANADSTIRSDNYESVFYNFGIPYQSYIRNHHQFYGPCNSALPVTVLSFIANKKDNNAVLQWKTSNETNTAFFNVQRSTDGIHFTTIGNVKAAGNSSGERSYAYSDLNVNALGVSKVYYRLAQQDVNGSVHNSAIARIDIINGKLSITISPNPVRNSIGIYSPVAMQNAVIRIADMSGKVVYTSRTNLSAGTKSMIDASAFARGVYLVTVQNSTDKQVLKLVKE